MKLEDIGIRKKLLSAFFLILSTTLLASSVSYYTFSNLSDSLDTISKRNVPLMGYSMSLNQLAVELDAQILLLSRATTDAERLQYVNSINDILESLDNVSTSDFVDTLAGDSDKGPAGTFSISGSLDTKKADISALNRSVQENIQYKDAVRSEFATLATNHDRLDSELVRIIHSASTDFVVLAEKTFNRNGEIIDKMLDEYRE